MLYKISLVVLVITLTVFGRTKSSELSDDGYGLDVEAVEIAEMSLPLDPMAAPQVCIY